MHQNPQISLGILDIPNVTFVLFWMVKTYEKAHMIAYEADPEELGVKDLNRHRTHSMIMYPPQNYHISPSNGTFESMMFPTSLSVGMCIRFLEGI